MKINKQNHEEAKIKHNTLKRSLFFVQFLLLLKSKQMPETQLNQQSSFILKMNMESLISETSLESSSKMQLWGPRHQTKGVDLQKYIRQKYIHIGPWVQAIGYQAMSLTHTRANFVQLFHFVFCLVSIFHFGNSLRQLPI